MKLCRAEIEDMMKLDETASIEAITRHVCREIDPAHPIRNGPHFGPVRNTPGGFMRVLFFPHFVELDTPSNPQFPHTYKFYCDEEGKFLEWMLQESEPCKCRWCGKLMLPASGIEPIIVSGDGSDTWEEYCECPTCHAISLDIMRGIVCPACGGYFHPDAGIVDPATGEKTLCPFCNTAIHGGR